MNLQLRAIETTDLGRRVAKLEELLAEAEPKRGFDGRGARATAGFW
jgi:hypothetical protein